MRMYYMDEPLKGIGPMDAIAPQRYDAIRMRQQVSRLRNRLADAWICGCSPMFIRRLENMISTRWELLERAKQRNDNDDLQPA